MNKYHVVTLLATTLLFACQNSPSELQQLQNNWKLTSIDGQNVDAKIQSVLSIDKEGAAHGMLGCNNFFGEIALQDQQIRVEKMGNTRKMCLPKINKVEMQIAQTLSNWSDVKINDTKLTLKGEQHTLIYQLNDSANEKK